jgi:hypothetical protein
MINIFDSVKLIEKRDEIRSQFLVKKNERDYLEKFYPLIENLREWKYSTGPIFDQPPYTLEMAGYDGGRLLKKQYSGPFDGRLKEVYSSGFLGDEHVVTIDPSKPVNAPLNATFFCQNTDEVTISNIKFFNNKSHASEKAPELVSMKILYDYQENVKACIGVGNRNAYIIRLYYCNDDGVIISASMATAPYDIQANYTMEYDNDNKLVSVSSGKKLWERART